MPRAVLQSTIRAFCSILQLACLFSLRQLIRPGHILIGTVLTASARDLLVRLLCFDDGRRRVLHDLKLTVSEILHGGLTDTSRHLYLQATCLLPTSSAKKKSNYRRQSKLDRDVQEVSEDDTDDGEYQSGDFVRGKSMNALQCNSHRFLSLSLRQSR